jgi:hypothetical protein
VWQRDPLCGPSLDTACDPDWNTCGEGIDTTDAAGATEAEASDAADDGAAPVYGDAGGGTTGASLADGGFAGDAGARFDAVAPDARSDAERDEDARIALDGPLASRDGGSEAGDSDNQADSTTLASESSSDMDVEAADGSTVDTNAVPADAAASGDAHDRAPPRACRVRAAPAGGPMAVCELAGPVAEGAVCKSSTDCRPGLACVSDDSVTPAEAGIDSDSFGICRSFCCGGSCQPGAACTPRALYDGTSDPASIPVSTPLMVPVCIPIPTCRLLDPTSCPARMTCAPRGNAQATWCVETGSAKQNDPCDDHNHCAAGLVCGKSVGRCLALCHTADGGRECQEGTCQGQSDSLPDGFGLCINDAHQADGY